jgi:invasion protein IalB
MILRMAVLIVFGAIPAAMAQREPRLPLPAEKFSARPVQPPVSELPVLVSPAANPERWPVVQSPWTKFCGTDKNDLQAKSICLTVKEVRLRFHTAPFFAGVALIEAAGEDKKILRVTLPPDLQRSAPVRIRVDDDTPRSGDYRECRPNGCMWDFPADAAFVARLKAGERLHLEGVAASGEVASYRLPLGEFARANEGPPTDPAAFEKDQKRRWKERSRAPGRAEK